jgi:tRNA (adenine57-N1/adenine58-N1)-methyltransferase
MLIGKDRRVFLRTIRAGEKLQTHFGEILFDDLVGLPYGTQTRTHKGMGMYLLPPNMDDIINELKRETQIIYPKDLGYIALKLGVREGMRVIESGTGSGAMTSVLALMVGETGHVYTYERKPKHLDRAIKNLRMLGFEHRVTFIEKDIAEGFEQSDVNAVFLDLHNPQEFLGQARDALQGGGYLGVFVPTVNQMVTVLNDLYHGAWYLLQADELILRHWITIPERVRPNDEMIGHSGFLIFARAVAREIRILASELPTNDIDNDERPLDG